MIELVTFIAEHPQSAVLVFALIFAATAGFLLYKGFAKEVTRATKVADKFHDKFEIMQTSLETKLSDTRRDLVTHREDMGKATKAIQGDLLKTKERIFELKEEMIGEVRNVQKLAQQTEHTMTLANETANIALKNLSEKLGRVILIEQTVSAFDKQLAKMQENQGQSATEIAKHGQWFSSIAQALKYSKEKLDKLEAEQHAKKGSKNEV